MPAPAHAEIELKLSIAPEDAKKVSRLPLIRATAKGRPSTRSMHSVYYDTPEHDLKRERSALRLRREGGRWVQTFKSGGQVESGLHVRQELETRVPAQFLDYRALAESGASEVLTDPARRALLQPVFTATFRRTTRRLELAPGTDIELASDTGSITAKGESVPISELELELKAGPPEDLLAFAAQLVEQIPVRLEPVSKAERGYRLAERVGEGPVKAAAPALAIAMTTVEALRAVVFSCLGQLQANERGVMAGGDPEYLHQARVALRRVRSAFTVFGKAFPRTAFDEVLGEIRWLGNALGPARDWDVFTLTALPKLAAAFPEDKGVQVLVQRAAELRTESNRVAAEAIGSTRYTQLLLKLTGAFYRQPWLAIADEQAVVMRGLPLAAFANEVLSRRHRKVLKAGRQHKSLDHHHLHLLRIEIKKLRYAAEFFSSLFERKPVRSYTTALAQLQELLGGLNDAATVSRLCDRLRHTEDDHGYREAIGLARGWAGATAEDHLEQLPDAWKAFKDADPFW